MTERNSIHTNPSGVSQAMAEAGNEMERIAREQIVPAAAIIEDAFERAGSSIQSNLERAAARGELSLKKLSRALVQDLRGFAIENFVRQPIETLLTGLFSAPFGGARAGGGFVAPGQSYLVGERGPELFTPGVSGAVQPPGGGVNVTIALPGVTEPERFKRSETQIAAALARALSRGQRNL
ncbi:MAG: phage tail tape measure protein [Pseudomonadota bacterium]